jgi:hypothetical protein
VSCHHNRGPIIDSPGSLDTADRTAIARPNEPSKRALVIAAALALVADAVVTTQGSPITAWQSRATGNSYRPDTAGHWDSHPTRRLGSPLAAI